MLILIQDKILMCGKAGFMYGGAVAARWAHNPKVRGSIPFYATLFLFKGYVIVLPRIQQNWLLYSF